MKRTAIIDIGSNSVRLVIYQGHREIDNIKVFAQLRRHMNSEGNITQEGLDTLLSSLKDFAKIIKFYKVKNVLCGATATVRQAKNKEEIIGLAHEKAGLDIRIITEYEEAYYGCRAILNSTPMTDGYTVDLGGGSTEVTLVQNRKLVHYHSFPFGAVSLKQQFIKGDIPTIKELRELTKFVRQQFQTQPWIQKNTYPIFAIGGSARNLARAHQYMVAYPLKGEHLYKMDIDDMEEVQDRLKTLNFEYLSQVEGITKGRADTIIPATQVFIELGRLLDSEAFYLSRKGFRDGLLSAEDEIFDIPTVRRHHVRAIANFSPLYKSARQLCTQLKIAPTDTEFLEYGMALYNVGKRICPSDSLPHSFYFVANQAIGGFTHKQRVALALLASYHSRGQFRKHLEPYQLWFSKEEKQRLQILGAVIKFVEATELQGKSVVTDIKVLENKSDHLTLNLLMALNFPHKREEILKQKKHLERALKKEILIEFSHK